MMYKIDLLKGQGIPLRSRPETVMMTAVGAAVPVFAAVALFGFYLYGTIIISVQKGEIENYKNKIASKADVVSIQKAIDDEKVEISKSFDEVKSNIGRHKQTIPMITEIVSILPDSLLVKKLAFDQKMVKVKVKAKAKDEKKAKTENKMVPARSCEIILAGNSRSDCGAAVQDFSSKLRNSKVFGSNLDDVKISQEISTIDGQEAINYIINCIFKPGI